MSKKAKESYKVIKTMVSNDVEKAYEKAMQKFNTRKRFIKMTEDDKCFIFTKIR